MRIENKPARVFTIFDAPKLDPITVVLQDFGGGRGRLIAECYGNAWSAYWSGMGNRSIAEFIRASDPEYLSNKLTPPASRKPTKSDEAYLMRIAEAICSALRGEAIASQPTP